jgi:hypothetical protein
MQVIVQYDIAMRKFGRTKERKDNTWFYGWQGNNRSRIYSILGVAIGGYRGIKRTTTHALLSEILFPTGDSGETTGGGLF